MTQAQAQARSARAFAPATVANVAVGFDILGFAIEGVGDEVTASVLSGSHDVRIDEITGVVTKLPKDASKNVASVALRKMIDDLQLDHGFSLKIKKGIPLSSGMGGSAASAVAAVVAANATLAKPLPASELLPFALAGEAAASGSIHGDNVGPSLLGGLCLILPTHAMRIVPLDLRAEVQCVLVHPEIEIETRQARGILRPTISLTEHVHQSAWLAGFIAGCAKGDTGLIQSSMIDLLIEPQRSQLIPAFDEMKALAMKSGVLGFSISGSGPSVFAWMPAKAAAQPLADGLRKILREAGIASQSWISPIAHQGARVIP